MIQFQKIVEHLEKVIINEKRKRLKRFHVRRTEKVDVEIVQFFVARAKAEDIKNLEVIII